MAKALPDRKEAQGLVARPHRAKPKRPMSYCQSRTVPKYAILYYTILYYTILYYTILYYTILYYTILYSTILYSTILYYTLLYYTILYSTLLYSTLLYYTILYYTILYYTILYYTILYYTILYYTILYYTVLHMLLQQRRDTWITPAMFTPRCLQVSSQGVQFSIAVQAPVRASDICEAECRLSGEQLQICVCFKERTLDAQDLLHAACRYHLVIRDTPVVAAVAASRDTPAGAIWWGLQMLLSFRDDRHFVVVPLRAVLDLATPSIDFTAPVFALGPALRDGHGFLLPLLSDGQWSLLVIQRVDEQLLSTHDHFDGIPGRNFALACHIVESVSGLMRECVADPKDVALGLQSDANACGAMLLAHAACVLGLADVPFEHHVAWAMHYLATCSLPAGGPSGAGGLSHACSKLGVGAVAQALQAKQPWAALKVAASKPSTMFRWVTTAELQEHIDLRATQPFGTMPSVRSRRILPGSHITLSTWTLLLCRWHPGVSRRLRVSR